MGEALVYIPLSHLSKENITLGISRRILVYTFEEEPEVFRVNPGRDPMPQVCNPRPRLPPAFKTLAHPLNLPFNRFLPAIQHVRVQISLERNIWTGYFPSNGQFDAPIQPNHIVTAPLSDPFQGGVRSFRKEGEGNDWKPLIPQSPTNFSGDIFEGRQRELGKIVR
jgi:hypothetical protein